MVLWVKPVPSNAGGVDLIPGSETTERPSTHTVLSAHTSGLTFSQTSVGKSSVSSGVFMSIICRLSTCSSGTLVSSCSWWKKLHRPVHVVFPSPVRWVPEVRPNSGETAPEKRSPGTAFRPGWDLKSGPGNQGRSACGTTPVAHLEFPRVDGLILRCAGIS